VKSKDERINEVLEQSMRRCPLKDTLIRQIKVNVNWKVEKE
jgi:uncharacterized OsmC-like protein